MLCSVCRNVRGDEEFPDKDHDGVPDALEGKTPKALACKSCVARK